jgi:hypothetical protein
MSSDLAKLKEQLGKIMNKADSYEKMTKNNQSTNSSNLQSFN